MFTREPLFQKRLSVVFAAFLAMAGVCCGQPAARQQASSTLNKQDIAEYLRYLYLWSPEVKIDVSDPKPSAVQGLYEVIVTASSAGAASRQTLLVTPDGRKIIRGEVLEIGRNPFQEDASRLSLDDAPTLGPKDAPVVIVLFTDFQCPFCRSQAQTIRANLTSAYPKEVRLVFKDFPLEQIHPWAKQAAIAGRCVFEQNADVFWEYHDWIFAQQPSINAATLNNRVMDFARGRPLDSLQLSRCLQTKAAEPAVLKSIREAESLQLTATPTLFINGRRISQQLSWQQLKAVIDTELRYLNRKEATRTRR